MHKRASPYTNTSPLSHGFTIVELLIVIVVIGILAALVLNTFSGAQKKARDSKRKDDISKITKALELYYVDYGRYPSSGGSTTINSAWSTTADSSWDAFSNTLRPYMGEVPKDPVSRPGVSMAGNYSYFTHSNSSYCAAPNYQMYILVYQLEAEAQVNTLNGPCPSTPLIYNAYSNVRRIAQ